MESLDDPSPGDKFEVGDIISLWIPRLGHKNQFRGIVTKVDKEVHFSYITNWEGLDISDDPRHNPKSFNLNSKYSQREDSEDFYYVVGENRVTTDIPDYLFDREEDI
jgi:hypothetical protein